MRPWATSRALYRVSFPYASCFMSNTKQVLTVFCFSLLTLVLHQVPSCLCATTLSLMAFCHKSQSGQARASFSFAGGLVKSQPSLAADSEPLAEYALKSFSH